MNNGLLLSTTAHIEEGTPVTVTNEYIGFGGSYPGMFLFMKPEIQLQLAQLIIEHHKKSLITKEDTAA